MLTETNQGTIVCRYCGKSIHSVFELRHHSETHCEQVEPVLSAKTKHGTTLGEHHAEAVTKRHGLKDSIDRHYHEIMLAEMTLELILILVLVILAWRAA